MIINFTPSSFQSPTPTVAVFGNISVLSGGVYYVADIEIVKYWQIEISYIPETTI